MKSVYYFAILLISLPVFSGIEWTKTYQGDLQVSDMGHEICKTPDGNYIGSVSISVYGDWGYASQDVGVIKMNDSGDELWTKTYAGRAIDHGRSIAPINDTGFWVTGRTASFSSNGLDDFYLLKLDQNGDTLNTFLYGGDHMEISSKVIATSDDGCIMVGETRSYGPATPSGNIFNMWIVKVDSDADTLWTKTIGTDGMQIAKGVVEVSTGGYIVTGKSKLLDDANYRTKIIKLDENGEIVWDKTYGLSCPYWSSGTAIVEDEDGNFIIVGEGTEGLLKIDSAGDKIWSKELTIDIDLRAIIITNEGNLIATGNKWETSANIYTVKYDSNGEIIWEELYGETEEYDTGNGIIQTTDGGYIVSGYTESYNSEGADIIYIKYESDEIVKINYELSIINYQLKQNYPNPFNPVTKINYQLSIVNYESAEIVVHNSAGQKIWSSPVGATPVARPSSATNNHGSIQFDGSNLNSGIYYYSLIVDGKKMDTKSMILIK